MGEPSASDDPGEDFLHTLDEEKLTALIETMYLAAFADGEFSEDERVHFATSVEYLTRGRLVGEALEGVLAKARDSLDSTSRDECIASLKERLGEPMIRKIALVLATDMVAADGVLHPDERDLVVSLARAFELGAEDAQDLVEGLTREAASVIEG